jgi:hypothetical protein
MNTTSTTPRHDEHGEALTLLPWFVNGSLSAQEAARVSAHLQHCAGCRQETRWLTQLREAVQDDATQEAMHLGMQRIWGKIEQAAQPPEPQRTRLQQGWARAREQLASIAHGFTHTRLAGALSVLLVALLSGAWWWSPWPHGSPTEAPYRMLSAMPPKVAPGSASEAQIAVIFKQDASRETIATLLQDTRSRLLTGPTPEGAYVLAVDAARMRTTLQALQQRPDIRFAEPVQGTELEQP